MLYLDRKKNQSIELKDKTTGNVVHVVILDIQGKNVRIGFEDESNSHTILRKEVRQRNEGLPDANPFYQDRIPNKPPKKESAPDPLEALLDELIPSTDQLPPRNEEQQEQSSHPIHCPVPMEATT